jgi:tetratricopeptide (TPR) repeat protein
MPGLKLHLDDFTLLRLTARDLSVQELSRARSHVSACRTCESALARMRGLDDALRSLAAEGRFPSGPESEFAPDDPFRDRPRLTTRTFREPVAADAVQASERALHFEEQLVGAIRKPEDVPAVVSTLDSGRSDHRFALLYALQEAGRRSAESPFGARRLAEEALRWLREAALRSETPDETFAERLVPRLQVRAQARLLLGIACLWAKEFSKAAGHLLMAYRSFARAGGDTTSLAIVEMCESQRRALAGEGGTALLLARRCRATFEELGLEDMTARAMVAEGMAFNALGRQDEAVTAYLAATPVFEKYGLWSNYVGALNNAASALIRSGRIEEAKRLFAKALRRFSRDQHRYWLGYIRVGLAEALFAAGQFPEAAVSAARAVRVFSEASLRPHALIAMLLEVECRARCGSLERARRRLAFFWTEIRKDKALDAAVVHELSDALSGADTSYLKLASLRRKVSDLIQERYRAG